MIQFLISLKSANLRETCLRCLLIGNISVISFAIKLSWITEVGKPRGWWLVIVSVIFLHHSRINENGFTLRDSIITWHCEILHKYTFSIYLINIRLMNTTLASHKLLNISCLLCMVKFLWVFDFGIQLTINNWKHTYPITTINLYNGLDSLYQWTTLITGEELLLCCPHLKR